jgi:hypothetical protein
MIHREDRPTGKKPAPESDEENDDLSRFDDLSGGEEEGGLGEDEDLPEITNREVGLLQLSIATSMAIESFCGLSPPKDETVAYNVSDQFDTLWINLRTLYRNYLGSFDATSRPRPATVVKDLIDEIYTITRTVAEYSGNRCSVMCYFSNYSDVERKHPGAVVRAMSTDKQKEAYSFSLKVFAELFRQIKKYKIPFLGINDLITKWGFVNNAIITHYAYDLLAHSVTFRLTLLESHTGALKSKALWHTKYLDGKDLPMIPFTRQFLQIFGDKETFRPFDPKVRRDIVEIAKKYKWNGNTSDSMIRYGLGSMKNRYALDVIGRLNHS